ncbi:MAG: GGDEF domain-containing protein, partial [Chromatiales bacterium]
SAPSPEPRPISEPDPSRHVIAEQPAEETAASIDFHKLAQIPEEDDHLAPLSEDEPHNQGNEIYRLKNTLQNRLDSTKNQCKEFEGLMQLLLADLREATNATEVSTIREMLKRAIQRLLSEHETISGNIVDVANELNRFGNHCEQLNHELGLVKRLSLTDELTRLPNRRAFLKRLKNESGRVQRYGYPLSVALIDLDLFKEINDTYGHAIGDEVLQTYTEKVLSTFRNYDLVARYGGEEFAVLLPHTDLAGAERALNKVLQRTVNTVIPASEHNQELKVPTFSAGVAIYHEGEPIESVINRADKAMYTAKKLGRNRVVVQADS